MDVTIRDLPWITYTMKCTIMMKKINFDVRITI
jgi:hypothetical protein